MNGSKKARNAASISNNTDIFGSMAGKPSNTGRNVFAIHAIRRRANPGLLCKTVGRGRVGAAEARACLVLNGLLSVNPQSAGGVGNMFSRQR